MDFVDWFESFECVEKWEFLRDENSIGVWFNGFSVIGGVKLSRLTSRLSVDVRPKSIKSNDKCPKSGWVMGDRLDESIGSVTVFERD